MTAPTRLSENRRRRHRINGLTITHLLMLVLLVELLRLLVLVLLLERNIGGRFPGGVLLELFLLFELHEVAFEAFEVAGRGLDEVFGLVGGFEGFEHGADLVGMLAPIHLMLWLHMHGEKGWLLTERTCLSFGRDVRAYAHLTVVRDTT
jgi:hypothetical protein